MIFLELHKRFSSVTHKKALFGPKEADLGPFGPKNAIQLKWPIQINSNANLVYQTNREDQIHFFVLDVCPSHVP